MKEYKIIHTYADTVQNSMNELVQQGWMFISMSCSEHRVAVVMEKDSDNEIDG